MTTPPSFPTLAGQGWSVHKKPMFATIVASHVSGREVRDALYENPIWEFELTFDGLNSASSYPGLGANSLQALMGLFLSCRGQFWDLPLYRPDRQRRDGGRHRDRRRGDHDLHLRPLSRLVLRAGRLGDDRLERLSQRRQPGLGLVADDAEQPRLRHPAGQYGVAITATFAYAFQCRFDADDLDFEEFMQNLWSAKSVKFRSVQSILDEGDHDRRHQPDQRRARRRPTRRSPSPSASSSPRPSARFTPGRTSTTRSSTTA